MTKKIAVVCNYELLENRVGGMDYFFWEFNKKCQLNHIEVDWFFPNISLHGDYDTFNIIPVNQKKIEKSVLAYLKKTKPAYSHVFTHFVELCTTFFAELKKLQTVKIIAIDHNPRPLNGYPLKKKIKKKLKGYLYSKNISLFIGVSEYTTNAIIKDFGGFLKAKTKTIYNGVLIDDILPKTTKREKVNPKFLVVSHLRFSKGIQDLIESVNLLSQDLKANLRIDVFGDGPYKSNLTQLVEKKHLEDVFTFKGSKSNLNETYQHYDYLLQPTHMECFSLSILESLSANIPVITTPVGGNTEVVEHNRNGFIFEARNIKELARLLAGVIKGEKMILENTRIQIEETFSIDLMVSNYMKLLDT